MKKQGWFRCALLASALFALMACQSHQAKSHSHQALDGAPPIGEVAERPTDRSSERPAPRQDDAHSSRAVAPDRDAEHYSLSVQQLPTAKVLRRLAELADFNLDLRAPAEGRLTLVAREQTVPQLLERIATSQGLRYEWRGDTLLVDRAEAYWRHYSVPYVNVDRLSERHTRLEGEQFSPSQEPQLVQQSEHRFWQNLEADLAQFEHLNLIVNRDVGMVSVYAKPRQQRAIAGFVDRVVERGRRQVLIEATVVEIDLSQSYQAGVDWQRVMNGGEWTLQQSMTKPSLAASPMTLLAQHEKQSRDSVTRAAVTLLEQFGDVNVHSRPRIVALNNQPSLLKVIDKRVYFTLDVQNTTASGGATTSTVETHINTLPVGFTMSVTPFVTQSDVTLSVRPSLSRITRFVDDPSPALAAEGIVSRVPEVEVREMETLLRLDGEQTALIGGLMQERRSEEHYAVPVLSRIPWLGELFKGREERWNKSELVILLRARRVYESQGVRVAKEGCCGE
ncbi:type II and III secretion system protein [gamma proteobacterium HTCC5015]|nr:type II and III secretion system protein [gamma proteobacterium HTCC5015]